jgi:hypothetical protein
MSFGFEYKLICSLSVILAVLATRQLLPKTSNDKFNNHGLHFVESELPEYVLSFTDESFKLNGQLVTRNSPSNIRCLTSDYHCLHFKPCL